MNVCHLTQSELKDAKYMCARAHAHTHTHTQTPTLLCPVPNSGPNRKHRCDIYCILLPTRTGHAAVKVLSKYDDILFGGDSDLSGNSLLARVVVLFRKLLVSPTATVLLWHKGGSCTKDGHCCLYKVL
jgi:hypothetical protein